MLDSKSKKYPGRKHWYRGEISGNGKNTIKNIILMRLLREMTNSRTQGKKYTK